MHIIIY